MSRKTLSTCFVAMKALGVEVDWSIARGPTPSAAISPPPPKKYSPEDIAAVLKKSPLLLPEIAQRFGMTKGQALDAIEALGVAGLNVTEHDGLWGISRQSQPAYTTGLKFEYRSRPDSTYVFGVVGDTHLCSKYAREDVLKDLYRWFAERKVDRVYHCGNWIEGEARFNMHDLSVHGMDAQCRYLAEHYPVQPGLTTYAVTGDDHEGWYAQREGVDIGRYAEQRFRDRNREDWVNLGYMEAHIPLVNAQTGKSAIMAVVHPGGGSSYADSYVVQKIIESLEGGEKPAVALYGHYHKMLAGEYRNVWWLMPGCTKDQDPFARKKRLRYVIGGAIVTLHQDENTGAITDFVPHQRRYFNRGYYDGRWSQSGDVVLPERTP